ncbi:MAG TPA: cupredoxin domain-containing protein, partial [Nitrososphaeraceae archaeon]
MRIGQVVLLTLVVLTLQTMSQLISNIFFSNPEGYIFSTINYKIEHIVTPAFANYPTVTSTNLQQNQNQNQSTHSIIIKSGSGENAGVVPVAFEPNQLFIKTGDKVVWVNKDRTNHSVVSLSFNSGIIEPTGSKGNSYSYVFARPGTYIYVDRFHPYMGGVIYVDVPASQRELISTTGGGFFNVKVEMPQNAAYKNNYGPYFIPATVTVPQKAKVTWINKDYVTHTATSGDGGKAFDTHPILPGESKTLNINLPKGAYSYYCEIHPWMLG